MYSRLAPRFLELALYCVHTPSPRVNKTSLLTDSISLWTYSCNSYSLSITEYSEGLPRCYWPTMYSRVSGDMQCASSTCSPIWWSTLRPCRRMSVNPVISNSISCSGVGYERGYIRITTRVGYHAADKIWMARNCNRTGRKYRRLQPWSQVKFCCATLILQFSKVLYTTPSTYICVGTWLMAIGLWMYELSGN
jgi:hypothetical protein